MENGWTFESWRPVWAQYGGGVVDAARVAFPAKSNEELRAHIIEASALAMVDETTFDPLESLITRLLAQASRESRQRAAVVLQQHRISDSRIKAMVGVSGLRPVEKVQHRSFLGAVPFQRDCSGVNGRRRCPCSTRTGTPQIGRLVRRIASRHRRNERRRHSFKRSRRWIVRKRCRSPLTITETGRTG